MITKTFFKFIVVLAPLSVSLSVYAQTEEAQSKCENITDLSSASQCAVSFLSDVFVPFLFAIALLAFLYGVFNYVRNADNEGKRSESLRLIAWSLIGLFFMTSAWAFAAMFANFFGAEGAPSSLIIPQFK